MDAFKKFVTKHEKQISDGATSAGCVLVGLGALSGVGISIYQDVKNGSCDYSQAAAISGYGIAGGYLLAGMLCCGIGKLIDSCKK